MKNADSKILTRVLDLAQEMMLIADEGDEHRGDVGCGVLYGTIRDYAYKIRSLAELEITEHKKQGIWQETSSP